MGLIIPPQFKSWPTDATQLPNKKIVELYNSGFAGVGTDDDAKAELRNIVASKGYSFNGSDIAHENNFASSHAGKLVILFPHVEKLFPGCYPGAAQERGDCVSHDEKNACLVSICCEIVAGLPDEITGRLEGVPEVSTAGILEGVLSTEWVYWWRGYNGDGWSCDAAAAVTLKYGILLRKTYPGLNLDLTNYSGSLAGKYGSKSPPENMAQEGKLHQIRTATELSSFEEIRDFQGNGYGLSSCGGEGFSSTRNEDGVSSRKGGWSHAFAYLGVDDRDIIKAKYGEPLVLCCNSWGRWNTGPRRILGTNIDIPEGCWWAKWSDVKKRYVIARSSVNGWPRRNLPHFGATGII